MRQDQSGPFLSAVFVDYDNIYLSLRRKSEEAAKRFAKDAMGWLKHIETGALITPTNGQPPGGTRRIVMNRCYGNPVPRRNTNDNSTDMCSFPFVRHHFLRAGFEVVDCPPLTAQLKNSSDIRMVMDLRDYLGHETHFDEFIILSGDADFTPVLHRLRAHARRTVIYATEYTAAPYTAISDGEVREADLIAMLVDSRVGADQGAGEIAAPQAPTLEATRRAILDEVISAVRSAVAPVPLEVLADRAVRSIGHERTIGTGWAGAGGFRELLAQGLPTGLRLSGEPPYVVIDTQRHVSQPSTASQLSPQSVEPADMRPERAERLSVPPLRETAMDTPSFAGHGGARQPENAQPSAAGTGGIPMSGLGLRRSAVDPTPSATLKPEPAANIASSIQQSIARIHEACKAPPLAPPEYRALFELIAQEITENGLVGAQTIQNIVQRAQDRGIDARRDDVRFVLEVVSEADPWFEQGASANLFAGRFRNFVVARCRAQGLTLSADELDLVEAWFAGGVASPAPRQQPATPVPAFSPPPARNPPGQGAETGYWSGLDDARPSPSSEMRPRASAGAGEHGDISGEDFPRIVRARLRG